jgi:hypothetical protein
VPPDLDELAWGLFGSPQYIRAASSWISAERSPCSNRDTICG